MWLLRCYVTMYGRLRAEEALYQVGVINAGDSMIEKGPRQRLISDWRRQAQPEAYQPRSVEDIARGLASVFGGL